MCCKEERPIDKTKETIFFSGTKQKGLEQAEKRSRKKSIPCEELLRKGVEIIGTCVSYGTGLRTFS